MDETTPIFDEMVSAWFRAATDQPEPWRFDADAGFHAAQAASRVEPVDYTTTGLPRRTPRQNLVPGSVAHDSPTGPPRHGRAAADVRERLSDYRHGVRRARDEQQAGSFGPDGTGWRFAADVGRREPAAPVGFTSGGLPRRTPLDNLMPGSVAPVPGDGPPRVERAEELRGRLGNFQRGLSLGRRSLAERAAAHGHRYNEQQERG